MPKKFFIWSLRSKFRFYQFLCLPRLCKTKSCIGVVDNHTWFFIPIYLIKLTPQKSIISVIARSKLYCLSWSSSSCFSMTSKKFFKQIFVRVKKWYWTSIPFLCFNESWLLKRLIKHYQIQTFRFLRENALKGVTFMA